MTEAVRATDYVESAAHLIDEMAEAYDAEEFARAAQLAQMAVANISMAQMLMMQVQMERMMELSRGTRMDTKSFIAQAAEMLTGRRGEDDLPEA